jgi:hypothetical protein
MSNTHPTERPVNPFNPAERPTFLPGDKVRDVRDLTRRTWRIVRRTAYEMSELMTLREVGDDSNQITVQSHLLVPHLRMVAPYRVGSATE